MLSRAWIASAILIALLAFAPTSSAQDTASSAEDATSAAPTPAAPPPAARAPIQRTATPRASASAKRPSVQPIPSAGAEDAPDEASQVTPRRAFAGFLEASDRGDFEAAAEFLDLRGLPRGRAERDGPELASKLYRVLGWRVPLDPEVLPDEVAPLGVGPEGIVLDALEIEGKAMTLSLAPVRQPSGKIRWVFPRSTVASVRAIYDANERLVVEDQVPEWLKRFVVLGLFPWQWIGLLIVLLVSYGLGRGLGSLAAAVLHRVARPFSRTLVEAAKGLERPTRLAIAVAAFQLFCPYLVLVATLNRTIAKAATILYIVAIAWAAIAIMRVFTASWERRLPEDTIGDLESRGLRTRLAMVRRIGSVMVSLVASGVVLLQFEVVRSVGLSLLASAGILGVLVGFAAQRTLGGIISGIEMSITQPVRIGDVVVFRPGEFGTVEQIYFTYIIVRLWDDRRLIVPVVRVMSDLFENWTRTDARLLAPVEIYVDYAAPLEVLRERFQALCERNVKWDGRVCRVEVVEATDKALRIRGTASVDVATKMVDLRNELREGWILDLQELEGGRYLPIGRVESRTVASEIATATPAAPTPAAPTPAAPLSPSARPR